MDCLRLPQQTLFNRHHPKLPSSDGFAPGWTRQRRGLECAIFPTFVVVAVICVDIAVFFYGSRIAHITIRLGLNPNSVMFEIAVCTNSRVKVISVVL